jgi:hypothetical protein
MITMIMILRGGGGLPKDLVDFLGGGGFEKGPKIILKNMNCPIKVKANMSGSTSSLVLFILIFTCCPKFFCSAFLNNSFGRVETHEVGWRAPELVRSQRIRLYSGQAAQLFGLVPGWKAIAARGKEDPFPQRSGLRGGFEEIST